MTEEIVRLTEEDYEEAVDFINYVFSYAHNPHDFPAILPKLYAPGSGAMPHHFAIRKNGRIRAMVGAFPLTLQAGSRRLKVAGIGSVSSHPYAQGAGYMRTLMNEVLRHLHAEGFHLSVLGGERRRYLNFGYEKAGTALECNVTKKSASIGLPVGVAQDGSQDSRSGLQGGLRFERIGEGDVQRIAEAKRLHDRQLIHAERAEEQFYHCAKTWKRELWAMLRGDGRMAGYLVATEKRDRVSEFVVESPDLLTEAIRGWTADQPNKSVTFIVPPWDAALARSAVPISESVSMRESYSFLIRDWEQVVGALLQVKAQNAALAEGEAAIGIRGYGTLRIAVRGGAASCERTEAEPDAWWDAPQAAQILFGPLPVFWANGVPARLQPLLASWLPLPLHWPEQDQV